MNTINYLYRGISHIFTLTSSEDDVKALFDSILKEKQKGSETMLIMLPGGGVKMISPIEIVDLTLCDSTQMKGR